MFRNHEKAIYDLKKNIKPVQLSFYLVWLVIAAFSIACLIHTHGGCLDNVVFSRGTDRFMDFFNHISYTRENGMANVYKTNANACFPPFIYLMYYFFSLILPENATVIAYCELTSSYALLLYMWYCIALTVVLCLTVIKILSAFNARYQFSMIGIIITSNIFLFGVLERGNAVIIACLLIMWAVILRNSKEKYKQELALIMIAAAASIKIYPAVFGLIYIFEKQWGKAARLVLYGLCFFFIPFCFFGGVEGFRTFLSNQQFVQSGVGAGFSSIKALYYYIIRKMNLMPSRADAIGTLCAVIYFVLAVSASYAHTVMWKRVYLLISIMILCPFWSGNYTLILMSVPLLLFMSDMTGENAFSKINILYAVLFALMFSFCTFSVKTIENVFGLSFAVIITYLPIYIIDILLIADGIRKNINSLVKHKEKMARC